MKYRRLIKTLLTWCLASVAAGCTIPKSAATNTSVGCSEAPSQGHALLLKAAGAMGGRQAFASLISWRAELSASLHEKGQRGTAAGSVRSATAEYVVALPDRIWRRNFLHGMGEISFVIRGDEVQFKPPTADSLSPASPEAEEYLRAGLWRELPFLIAHAVRCTGGLSVQYAGRKEVSGTSHDMLQIDPPGDVQGYLLHLDSRTGLPVKRVFKQGEDEVEDVFSDFRSTGQLVLPYRVQSFREGHLSEDISYERIVIGAPFPEILTDGGE